MHLNVSQQMRMSQQMKLAPRMIQSMEILQLPLMALQERIDQELAENIVLEQLSPRLEDAEPAPTTEGPYEAPQVEIERRELNASEDGNASDFERLLEMSQEWPDDNYTSGSKPSSNRIQDDMDRANDVMANAASRPQTLHEHLLEQFHCDCPEHLRGFGEYLIHNLDENGRLQSSLPELAQVFGKKISLEDAQQTLRIIQRLDPPGVGARDLKECLLLQITPDTPLRDILVTIITNHLDDVLQNRLPLIERKTGYTLDDVKCAIEQMRTLNPYPGRGFETPHVETVTPDLKVEKDEETGKYAVQLIDEFVPQLRISRRYLRMLEGNPDPATKEYIKKKIESAKWLIDSIEQRYNTLKRVAQAIVDEQTEFLDYGPEYIKPLKMQDIADVVKVHVTTVSRAVDDKYIATPRGIFALKRFFGGGTSTSDGEDVAWEKIRLKLKEVVDGEDKRDPLSDDALVSELAKHGFNLARRTVTKYRKALKIPSSRQRREY